MPLTTYYSSRFSSFEKKVDDEKNTNDSRKKKRKKRKKKKRKSGKGSSGNTICPILVFRDCGWPCCQPCISPGCQACFSPACCQPGCNLPFCLCGNKVMMLQILMMRSEVEGKSYEDGDECDERVF
ncbi:hypothetical protein HELRODRAFT_158925 [Helobdella robusta]|uniref:Uncharacterized protein n=1 Tax=Helobdella robusta TaxID=6412 RepID=T1ENE9_HELRO|nr:hypothetical protein HELRODRAFT_158925 [Helobdella robusta]ESO12404.1 hypothetical protein HELRODRAFT_158925 [Helobdella robusta]